jgi:hypothetical protein
MRNSDHNLKRKNISYLRRMVSSGLLRRVALVRTDVSEEPGASFIRVTKICELGTTQAATRRRQVPPKRRSLQEPHGVTTQKTPFFIVTAVKISNLISYLRLFPTQLQYIEME